MTRLTRFYVPLCLLALINIAYAENIGVAAEALTQPLGDFADFIYKLCYVIGFVLFVGGLVQYKRHRNNPIAVPISTPVTLILLGLAIGLLPLIPHWLSSTTGVGVQYMPNTM